MLGALLLLGSFYLPGHFLGGALVRKGDGWGEAVMLRLAASTAVAAPVLVGLAVAGWFTFLAVVGSFGACAVVAWFWARRREGFVARFSGWDAAVLALVGGSFALYAARPAEYVINSRDPGVYTLIADRLARTGEFFVRDPLVGAVAAFHDFRRGEKYPGLYIYGEDLLVPQFFPGPFGFLGFGNLVGGLWGSFYVVPVFGALAVGMAFLLGSELFGRWAGALGAALLATSYAQVWWARHPSSEIATQFFVLAGLWILARFVRRGGDAGTGVMAGLLLGGAMLVRVDAFLAAAALPLLAGYDLFVGRQVRRWLYPAVPLVLAGLAGLLYLNTIAGRYLNLIYGRHDLDEALKLAPHALVAATVLAGVLWAVRRLYGGRVDVWLRVRGGRVAVAGALVVVGVALWGYFVLPVPWENLPVDSRDYDAYREQILVRLTWFITPPVALLALLGFVLAARRPNAARMLLFGAVLSFGILYTLVPNVAPDLPWATRRFVPTVFPGVSLLAGFAAVEAGRWASRLLGPRAGLALTGALAVVACAWTLHTTGPILTFRELEGAVAAFDRVESGIPEADVVFVEVPDATDRSASTFEYLYGRPVLPYSRDRFRRERDELKEAGLLDDALYVTLEGMPAPLISRYEFDEVAREEAVLPRLDPIEGNEEGLSMRIEPLHLTYRVFRVEAETR